MGDPTLVIGQSSVQVEVDGRFVMSVPHRVWEKVVSESGEMRWRSRRRTAQETRLMRSAMKKLLIRRDSPLPS